MSFLCFPVRGLNSRYRKLIDIIETVYRGASKGRGLVVSPKGTSLICPAHSSADLSQQTIRHATGTKEIPITIPSSLPVCKVISLACCLNRSMVEMKSLHVAVPIRPPTACEGTKLT